MILPVLSVSDVGDSWTSIDSALSFSDIPDEATLTWYGWVSDGDYDIYGNVQFTRRTGPLPQTGDTNILYDGTRTTYAWTSDDGVREWNLVRAPATVETGYPDSSGADFTTIWTSTSTTYSSEEGEEGWVTRVDAEALGDWEDSTGTVHANPSPDRWVTYAYERDTGAGAVEVTIDQGGLRTERRTTTWGRITEAVVESGGADVVLMTATLDEQGRVQAVTDANAAVTTFTYDDAGRLTSSTPPLGDATTLTYDLDASPPTVTQVTGDSQTTWTFDGLGRLVRTVTPNGTGAWSYGDVEYDSLGRLARVYLPHDGTEGGWVDTTWDTLGRATATERTDGSTTTTTSTVYDGWTVTSTDALGNATERTTDGLGRLALVDAPIGVDTVSYPAFATHGEQIHVNDADGDQVGYQARILDGSGAVWWLADWQTGDRYWVRDEAGEVVCEVDDNGDAVVTTRDDQGRVTASYDDTSCTPTSAARLTYSYSRTGPAVRLPVLGDRGAWDRFSRDDASIHVQYRLDRDAIDMITLMRLDTVP